MQLDKYQRKVVTKPIELDSALRVVANAGAGKSTTMLHKAVALNTEQGIPVSSIVMVSFSRKSREDLERKWKKISKDAPPVISTIHSLGLLILRKFLKEKVTLIKPYEQQRLVKHCIEEQATVKDIKVETFAVMNALSYYKSLNIDLKDSNKHALPKEVRVTLTPAELYQVVKAYAIHLRDNNQFDFDDLIYKTYRLLKASPEILAKVRKKFQVYIVDEAQDLNKANWDLIFLLSNHLRLIAVGDPCQNIYLFRYAQPSIFSEEAFGKHFAATSSTELPNNYRSTKEIVAFGNLVRKHSGDELRAIPKGKSDPNSLKIYVEEKAHLEGKQAVKIIQYLLRHGYKLSDITIISRSSNFLKTVVEKDVISANLPYKILAGMNAVNFHDTNSAVIFMAMIALLVNPNNMMAFTTLVPYMNGMGEFTRQRGGFEKVGKNAAMYMKLMLKHNRANVSTGNAKLDLQVQKFYNAILGKKDRLKAGQSFEYVLDELFAIHGEFVKEAHKIKNSQYIRIRSTVMNFLNDYFDHHNEKKLVKKEFEYFKSKKLRDAILEMLLNVDGYEPEETRDQLTLATVHSQKGLESKVTIACGFRAYGVMDDLGDECNILYVQTSRAIEKLIILRSKTFRRISGGNMEGNENVHLQKVMEMHEGAMSGESSAW